MVLTILGDSRLSGLGGISTQSTLADLCSLTDCAAEGAGESPTELAVSSRLSFALGFEKDLKRSDCSLLRPVGLPVAFLFVLPACWDLISKPDSAGLASLLPREAWLAGFSILVDGLLACWV